MTDAERRPMQRMIATGPRFARKGHGRPQEGGSHASQCHPQPEALQGLQCVVTTEPQKTSYWRAFPEFSEQYAPAREAGIRAGIHEIGGRNQTTARFPQAWLLMCNESAKKHNNGGRSEFKEQYAHARASLAFTQVAMKSAFASQCWLPGRLPLKSAMLAGAALQCL